MSRKAAFQRNGVFPVSPLKGTSMNQSACKHDANPESILSVKFSALANERNTQSERDEVESNSIPEKRFEGAWHRIAGDVGRPG